MDDNEKNKALRPRMAKILLVYIIKGSFVIKKIAGILSTAKITSTHSMKIRAKKRGVNHNSFF